MDHNCSMPARNFSPIQEPEEYQGKYRFIKQFKGSIFTLGNFDDAVRIQVGQQDPHSLKPCRCYALRPQNQPLLDEGILNDGSIPPFAYQNFRWCGILSNVIALHNDLYHIPGFEQESRRAHLDRLFLVDPLYDEGIYVVDIDAGKEYFARLSDSSRKVSTASRDLEESFRVTARTMIPISHYRGQFREPTILIGRELLFDEVKYVKSFSRR